MKTPAARARLALAPSAAALVLTTLLLAPSRAEAFTKVEGEFQLQLDVRKQDRFYPWDFESNNDDTYAASQFRIFTSPRNGVEGFMRIEADWNSGNNNNDRPLFQYRESHIRFRREFGDNSEFDSYLFSRQDRFWVENHLLQIVQGDKVKDGDNGQGVRFDLRRWFDIDATYIQSDFSGQTQVGGDTAPGSTDDAHIFRLRRTFRDNAIRAGMTYARKVETQDIDAENGLGWNEVYAVDFRATYANMDLFLEYADSRIAGSNAAPDGSFDFDAYELDEFNRLLPNDAAFKAELRSIRFGNPKLGYYNIAPQYYYFGHDYTANLGDATNDLVGYKINTWYLIPTHAITLTLDWEENRRSRFEDKLYRQFRAELYTEYVNGFTSKIWYDRRKTTDFANPLFAEEIKNYDLFAEVQVESKLAWMRVQGKIKDLETTFRKELVSLETSINLTDKLKIYNRYAFGNDPARLRKGVFSELQFRPAESFEMFLSYGPWWIGDDAVPVNDGDLAGSADNKDIIRLIMKGNF